MPPARSFITRSEAAPEYTACPPLSSLSKLLQQQESKRCSLAYFMTLTQLVREQPTKVRLLGLERKPWTAEASPGSAEALFFLVLSFFLLFYLFLSGSQPQSHKLEAEAKARLGLLPGPLSPLISAWAQRYTTTGGKSPGSTNEKETVGAAETRV